MIAVDEVVEVEVVVALVVVALVVVSVEEAHLVEEVVVVELVEVVSVAEELVEVLGEALVVEDEVVDEEDWAARQEDQERVVIEPHRHFGVFIARGKEDLLVTKNMNPGESVYGEKRISVEGPEGTKVEYRVWNPFRSKLAAGILGGLDEIYIKPGAKVLYLGAASGTSVSHVADIVGPEGFVYAVEFSHRSGRDLINMAKKRPNVIPIIEDARLPQKYRMLVGMVDVVFADVAQPDQARSVHCL